MSLLRTLTVCLLLWHICEVSSQVCSVDGTYAGQEAYQREDYSQSNETEYYLLVEDGVINCFGVIKAWNFYTDSCSGLTLDVWRLASPPSSRYKLIGSNPSISSCLGPSGTGYNVTLVISSINRIPVAPGDIIGWHDTSGGISYENSSGSGGMYATSNCSTGLPLCLFVNAEQRTVSLRAIVVQADPPVLDNLPVIIYVDESASKPSPVYTVRAHHVSSSLPRSDILFSFTMSPNVPQFIFQTPTNNGANGICTITVNSQLDYEWKNEFNLSVSVTALGMTDTKNIVIRVKNVNEPHIFTNLPNSVTVSAAAPPPSQIFQVSISDQDNVDLFPIRYFITAWTVNAANVTDAPPLTMNPDTGAIYNSVNLPDWVVQSAVSSPSYPSSLLYTLNVTATDGLHTASGALTVTIRNIRPLPTFTNLPDSVNIDETTAPGTVIFQVRVDSPNDLTSSYRIQSCYPLSDNFCLDATSGTVTVCSTASLRPKTTYSLGIIATSLTLLKSLGTLTINVGYTNTAPYFSPSTYAVSFDEKCGQEFQPCSSFVPSGVWPVPGLVLDVNDREMQLGFGDNVLCSIEQSFGSSFFKSPMSSCSQLKVDVSGSIIDVDTSPEYGSISLVIRATDSQSQMTFASVDVTVVNINDHWPIFDSSIYNATINENSPGGTSVITVTATDLDAGINGQITYSIQPRSDYFEIDGLSGVVMNKQPLDYETLQSHIVTVTASDAGNPPKTGTATLTVQVVDVNDNRPQFVCTTRPVDEPYDSSVCFYNLEASPDIVPGHHDVVQITATDVDTYTGNVITYQFLDAPSMFSLDSRHGNITVVGQLSSVSNYLLVCYANDNGNPNIISGMLYVRVDTYDLGRHLISFQMDVAGSHFDSQLFITNLRQITSPWFAKIHSVDRQSAKVTVSVYMLRDTSTYNVDSIDKTKQFVDRDEMLPLYRANIYGDPTEALTTGSMTQFNVVYVQATYPIWWIDSLPGIATVAALSCVAVIAMTTIAIALCKVYQKACFKPVQQPKGPHAWETTGVPHNSNPPDCLNYKQ